VKKTGAGGGCRAKWITSATGFLLHGRHGTVRKTNSDKQGERQGKILRRRRLERRGMRETGEDARNISEISLVVNRSYVRDGRPRNDRKRFGGGGDKGKRGA